MYGRKTVLKRRDATRSGEALLLPGRRTISFYISCENEPGAYMEITRHFTATTFVVYQDKTVLHLHRSLKMWLPPGGHIDRDELPHIAALREVKEETGLDVVLIHEPPAIHSQNAQEIPGPRHLLLENINPFHQHIDMIYFARANAFDVTPDQGESLDLKWFTADELEGDQIENDIRLLGQEAIRVVSENMKKVKR